MIAVVQRVTHAAVRVGEETVGEIGAGAVVLLGVLSGDGEKEARRLAHKVATFRFFADEEDRMNLSALDRGLEVLLVSQFTLAADGRRGRRPSFDRAAPPAVAELLYECFLRELGELGLRVASGRFGARMQVELIGDGPVTFVLQEVANDPPSGPPSAPG
jgi:D-tyrosyl-tRNA(Tyr) deacylase